ncbi:MAG: DNA-binding response OmpR family regulator [Planctomycetota bacterium]|jgi:DNA-binding response OmpR family regulator
MPEASERILLVEDDPRIREEACLALNRSGYEVFVAKNLAEARVKLLQGCEAVLLDLGLPDGEGLELCREIRNAGNDTPIVVVTARDANEQHIRGLDAGADD